MFVGLTLVCVCLTLLFLAMRSVMDIGGSCASGGPYQIARPCPDGVEWMFPVAIVGGLVALGIYQYGVTGLPGPHLILLAWPALFLSLGWNFLDYGMNPPGGGGLVWSWLICGVVFMAMGGLPLLVLLNRDAFRVTLWADVPGDPAAADRPQLIRFRTGSAGARTSVGSAPADFEARRPDTALSSSSEPDSAGADQPDDLASALERITDLYTAGALTSDEFTAAKHKLLEEDS